MLKDYRPKSIYKIPVTEIARAKFPIIDMHSHPYAKTPEQIAEWVHTMDERGNHRRGWLQSRMPRRPRTSLMSRPMGILKSGPTNEMRSAAQVGTPTMEAEPDTSSATDVLTGGNSSRIVVGGGSGTGRSTGSTTGIVATVTPGTKAENNGTTEGAADGTAPADGSTPPATDSSAPGAAQPDSNSVAPAGESSSAPPADATAGAATGSDAAGTAASTDPAKADAAKTDAKADSDTKTKESTSKKKKGVRKLIPW